MMSDNEIEEEILEDIEEPELSFSDSPLESLPSINLEESLGAAVDCPLPHTNDVFTSGKPPDAYPIDWKRDIDEEPGDEKPEEDYSSTPSEDTHADGTPLEVYSPCSENDIGEKCEVEVDSLSEQEGDLCQITNPEECLQPCRKQSTPSSAEVASTTTSPVFSNISELSLGSHNSHSDPHNDRSLSELSISVPKLAVVSVGSEQPVSRLVQQFSHRELGVCTPSSRSTSGPFQSLPPCLGERKYVLPPPKSSLGESISEVLRDKSLSKSRGNVASLINQFSVDSTEEREASMKQVLPVGPTRSVSSSITSTKDVIISLFEGENSFSSKFPHDSSLPEVDSCKNDISKSSGLPNNQDSKVLAIKDKSNKASATSHVQEEDAGAHNLELLCSIAFPASVCIEEESSNLGSWGCQRDVQETQNKDTVEEYEKKESSSLPSSARANSDVLCYDKEHGNVDSEALCKSVGHDTSEELLEIDIGGSDQEMLSADLSDASEIILGFISKSPISAITERTEESGQENEKSCGNSEENIDKSEHSLTHDRVREFQDPPGSGCKAVPSSQGTVEYFPPSFLSIDNDVASSQFTGMSSMHEEESIVQNQPYSLGMSSETFHPPSQSSHHNPLKMKKSNAKAKVTSKLNSNIRSSLKTSERCSTPPLSLHGHGMQHQGPLKPCLQRGTSKSMHNLAFGSSGKPRAPILQNRSFSLSTDHLERQSPRAKSLSPGPGFEQRLRTSADGRPHSSLARRCISAVALNRMDSQASMKRNQSVSLNRLNRSRSSSMTSVSSWRRADYSHISSKVKQYIRDMKDKDLRNSTRSLPATPAKKISKDRPEDKELRKIVIEELLLQDLSYLEEGEVPEAVLKLRDQIRTSLRVSHGDSKVLDQLLQLWAMERKLRYASDTTLAALQEHYNDLSTQYAEKQNEIDRLRFFKDVNFKSPGLGSDDKKRLSSSCHNTPPPTPYRIAGQLQQFHFQTSPNTPTRRLSVHTTPPNTPNIPSLSPSLVSNLNKTSSTPIVDPSLSITLEPNELSVHDAKSKRFTEEVTMEVWIKDANTVLRRVKEFALLEGSSALQQSERNIIWNSILNQYWRLSSQFPLLSLLPGSQQSGELVQSLGQAISGTASRFQLEIMPSKIANPPDHGAEESSGLGDVPVGKDVEERWATDCKVLECGDKAKEVCFQTLANSDKRENSLQSSKRSSQSDDACNDNLGNGSRVQSVDAKKCLTNTGVERGHHSQENKILRKEAMAIKLSIADEEDKSSHGNKMPVDEETEDPVLKESHDDDDYTKEVKDEILSPTPSPTPSHESMKTVGPLEKVTMWQESLIGSVVPHESYHSSSNLSAAASMLSLGSSQPFEAVNDLDLKDFHPLHSSTALSHNMDKEIYKEADLPITLTNEDGEIEVEQHGSGEGIALSKAGVPQWKSTAATHHLALGRAAVKARDLDSGCPGSERSTKVSQIASLEMVEPLEGSLHPEEALVNGSVELAQLGNLPMKSVNLECSIKKGLIEEESQYKLDSEVKRDCAGCNDNHRGFNKENSNPQVTWGEGQVLETCKKMSSLTDMKEDYSSRSEKPSLQNKVPRDKQKRKNLSDYIGADDKGKSDVSSQRERSRQPTLSKYDAKYTSGSLSSNSSERSTESPHSSSSAQIHNNISRLKRDLNYLKSQMMNLTSEVFEGKRKNSLSVRKKDENKRGACKPVKTNVNAYPGYDSYHPNDSIPRLRYHCSSGHSSDVEPNSKNDHPRNLTVKKNSLPRNKGSSLDNHRPRCELKPSYLLSVAGNNENQHSEIDTEMKNSFDGFKRRKPPSDFVWPEDQRTNRSFRKCHYHRDMDELVTSTTCIPLTEKMNKNIFAQITKNADESLSDDGQLRVESSLKKSRRRCRSSSPIIFIQNYNYNTDDRRTSVTSEKKQKGKSGRALSKRTYRHESSQSLMASLDQATTLAERLRLRSQSMLTQLHLTSTLASHHLSGAD